MTANVELTSLSNNNNNDSLPKKSSGSTTPVLTCTRGQVLTVLISPGFYALRSIPPRDCNGKPNFLLEIPQEVYNTIHDSRESILSKYFPDCRSDYAFGFHMQNNQLEGPASVRMKRTGQGKRTKVVFYNCEFNDETSYAIENKSMSDAGYLMFNIIHWRPKSFLKSSNPLPLYRFAFVSGRFFNHPEEWELFLHNERVRYQNEKENTEPCQTYKSITIGRIE